MSSLAKALEERRFRQAKLLVQLGDDLNSRSKETGRSPLVQASLIEDEDLSYKVCHWLLQEGADIAVRDDHGMNAFMHVCRQGRTRIAALFLKHRDFDLNTQDFEGNTALSYAVIAGDISTTSAIVAELRKRRIRGADKQNKNGETPLIIAAKLGHKGCADILLNDGEASPHARDMEMRLTAQEWVQFMNSKTNFDRKPSVTSRREAWWNTEHEVSEEKEITSGEVGKASELGLSTTAGKKTEDNLAQAQTMKGRTRGNIRGEEDRKISCEMFTRSCSVTEKPNRETRNDRKKFRQSYSAKEHSRCTTKDAPQRVIKSATFSCTKPGLSMIQSSNALNTSLQPITDEKNTTNASLVHSGENGIHRSKNGMEVRYHSTDINRAMSAPQRAYMQHVQRFRREKSVQPETEPKFLTHGYKKRNDSFTRKQLPKLLKALGEQNTSSYRPKASPPEPNTHWRGKRKPRSADPYRPSNSRRLSKVNLALFALRRFSGIYAKTDFSSLTNSQGSQTNGGALSLSGSLRSRRQSVAVMRGERPLDMASKWRKGSIIMATTIRPEVESLRRSMGKSIELGLTKRSSGVSLASSADSASTAPGPDICSFPVTS
ncbi:predicted protein [Nematostella vectensis]|uniref:Uncharacterized protein n=1 Tax=Nematostella vectensis TaxID=45351 RepID=A7SRL7_NEMVE|nr:predicted protein [Nematostella vectensis]|eukprot:XP_001625742.1 predicted protein [Nematostella vectensis]